MPMRLLPRLVLLLTITLQSCWDDPSTAPGSGSSVGYRPEYAAAAAIEISFGSSRMVTDPGKIYRYGDYLLVNERGKGIHIFNNTDPANPEAVGFLSIAGNTDMAIRNDLLYADHMGNIVEIELNGFSDVAIRSSLPLRNWNNGVPPPPGHPFECVDPSRGVVVKWRKTTLTNPGCYAF